MRVAIALIMAMALAACDPSRAPTPSGAPTDQLALRIQELPGLLPPGAKFTVPKVSLYGSGQVILGVQGDTALPAPTQRQISPQGMRKIYQAAADAELLGRLEHGRPMVPDAPVTTVTVVSGSDEFVTRVVGLGVTQDQGLTADQLAARERVRAFVAKFTDLDGWLGGDIGPAKPYQATRLAVYALPQDPPGDGKQWPLGPLATAGEPNDYGRCSVISGDQLSQVTAAVSGAKPRDLWRSGEALYFVILRPLLPDEVDCYSI